MKKTLLSLAFILLLSGCAVSMGATATTKDGITTTGDAVTSTSDNTTKATKSSSGDSDSNWEYDAGMPL